MGVNLPISARDVVPFTPREWKADRPGQEPPVYLIAVPTDRLLAAYERDLDWEGAQFVAPWQIRGALRDAATALLVDESRAAILADLDIIDELETKTLDDEQKKAFGEAIMRTSEFQVEARRRWPLLNRLIGDQNFWVQLAPRFAAKHFLRGWKNILRPCECQRNGKPTNGSAAASPEATEPQAPPPCEHCGGSGAIAVDFSTHEGQVEERALRLLPQGHLLTIYAEILALRTLRPEQKKS